MSQVMLLLTDDKMELLHLNEFILRMNHSWHQIKW